MAGFGGCAFPPLSGNHMFGREMDVVGEEGVTTGGGGDLPVVDGGDLGGSGWFSRAQHPQKRSSAHGSSFSSLDISAHLSALYKYLTYRHHTTPITDSLS